VALSQPSKIINICKALPSFKSCKVLFQLEEDHKIKLMSFKIIEPIDKISLELMKNKFLIIAAIYRERGLSDLNFRIICTLNWNIEEHYGTMQT